MKQAPGSTRVEHHSQNHAGEILYSIWMDERALQIQMADKKTARGHFVDNVWPQKFRAKNLTNMCSLSISTKKNQIDRPKNL